MEAQSSAPSNGNWKSVCSDHTGQYVTAADYSVGLYQSVDYGQDWKKLGLTDTTKSNTFSYVSCGAAGNYIYAGSNGVVYQSSNNGKSWSTLSSLSSGTAAYQIVSDSSTSQNALFVSATNGVKYSTNYGATWTPITSNNFASMPWSSVALDQQGVNSILGSKYHGLWISNGGTFGSGYTQVNVTSNAVVAKMNFVGVSADYTFTNLIAVAPGYPIWYSQSGGASSTWLQANGNTALSWSALSSFSSGQYAVATTTSGAIYYTSDFGADWTQATGLPSGVVWSSLALGRSTPRGVVVNTAGSIYYTDNYGAAWTNKPGNVPFFAALATVGINGGGLAAILFFVLLFICVGGYYIATRYAKDIDEYLDYGKQRPMASYSNQPQDDPHGDERL